MSTYHLIKHDTQQLTSKNGNILFHMIEFMIQKNSIIMQESKWPNLQICQIVA